jgi:hypothetical protein
MRRLVLAAVAPLVLAAGQDPSPHYQVSGRFDLERLTLTNAVTITLPPGRALDETFVFSRRFTIDEARVTGPARLTIGTTDKPIANLHSLRVVGSGNGVVRLRVRYHGPITDPDDKEMGASAQRVELGADWMWVPIQDQIALPFTLDADLRGLPAALTVVSQGTVARRGDRLTIRRRTADIDFVLLAARGLKQVSDSADVEVYARFPEDPLVRIFRKHAVGASRYFEDLLGPMTVRPLRIVVAPRNRADAYARAAYIVIAEAETAGKPLPDKFPERNPAKYVAHEAGHIWWLGANAQSEDNWVNESFAEYSALRYVEAAFGIEERRAAMARFGERAAQSGAMIGHGRPKSAAVYSRGPLLLFELEERIGRARMDAYLRALATEPSKTTASALRHLSTIAGPEVAKVLEEKLRAENYTPAG